MLKGNTLSLTPYPTRTGKTSLLLAESEYSVITYNVSNVKRQLGLTIQPINIRLVRKPQSQCGFTPILLGYGVRVRILHFIGFLHLTLCYPYLYLLVLPG